MDLVKRVEDCELHKEAFVLIQFPKPSSFLVWRMAAEEVGRAFHPRDESIVGVVIAEGQRIDFLRIPNPGYEEELLLGDRDIDYRLYIGYDPDPQRPNFGIRYPTDTGKRVLINGLSLTEEDRGAAGMDVTVSHFDRLTPDQMRDTIMFHTNYLRAVRAFVSVGIGAIRRNLAEQSKGFYLPVVEEVYTMLMDPAARLSPISLVPP